MPNNAVQGAQLMCTMGMQPCQLMPTPGSPPVQIEGKLAATIKDKESPVNIPTFGMCQSLANPQVAAATSAAMGVLTPQPCIPKVLAKWTPGSPQVLINGEHALLQTDTCQCMWAGTISITDPGETSTLTT